MRTRDVAWIAAIAVMIAGAAALQVAVHASRAVDTVAAAPSGAAPRDGDIVLGRAEAPVSVLVLSSLTCPHCARWEAEQLPAVERDLVATGRASLAIRDFPLNAPALEAAALVRCLPEASRPAARRRLMAGMERWAGKGLGAVSGTAGLSGEEAGRAVACARREDVRDAVLAGAEEAIRAYGVRGTPTFVVGRRVLSGAIPASDLARLVEEAATGR